MSVLKFVKEPRMKYPDPRASREFVLDWQSKISTRNLEERAGRYICGNCERGNYSYP